MIRYTSDMKDFLREFIPGHTGAEIRGAFERKFGITLTKSQIGNIKTNLGVKSGTVGGFKKGHIPHSAKDKPVGYERISKEGYVEVKVKGGSQDKVNENFRRKHHVVWEQAHGSIPPNTSIVFADGNKRNFDIDNLVAVPRSLWATICHQNIPFADSETLHCAMDIARTRQHVYAAKQKGKNYE